MEKQIIENRKFHELNASSLRKLSLRYNVHVKESYVLSVK